MSGKAEELSAFVKRIRDCVHMLLAHFEHGEKCYGWASCSHENGIFLPAAFEND